MFSLNQYKIQSPQTVTKQSHTENTTLLHTHTQDRTHTMPIKSTCKPAHARTHTTEKDMGGGGGGE